MPLAKLLDLLGRELFLATCSSVCSSEKAGDFSIEASSLSRKGWRNAFNKEPAGDCASSK